MGGEDYDEKQPKDGLFDGDLTNLNDEEDIISIKNPFSGLLGSMLECTVCKHANESRQTSFTCLTLSLMDEYRTNTNRNGFRNMTPSVKLVDRIKAFETAERIDGYRCM